MQNRLRFWWRYLRGQMPWDTQITPPEIVALAEQLPPGRALDLGCGTGTSSLYLAGRGWQTVGIDFIPRPVHAAQRKAKAAGLSSAEFYVGDVTRLDFLQGPFDLALDIGCLHSLDRAQQPLYAAELARLTRPGALYALYAFAPRLLGGRPVGLTPDDVRALFGGAFELLQVVEGKDKEDGPASAWYTLRRR